MALESDRPGFASQFPLSCVTWGKLLNLSGCLLPQVQNGVVIISAGRSAGRLGWLLRVCVSSVPWPACRQKAVDQLNVLGACHKSLPHHLFILFSVDLYKRKYVMFLEVMQ